MASTRNAAAFWLLCAGGNLAYVAVTAERGERVRRLQFIALLWPHNVVNVLGRYFILWLSLTQSWLYFALLVPLTVFDTTSIQVVTDLFEGRPLKRPTLRHVGKFVKVAAIESIGYVLACQLWPWLQTDAYEGPTVAALAHAVWRTALFDVGLDLGFYSFHRCCHVNRTLYRLVHAPHHTDTGKEYGHLVASETYELSVVETLSILSSYLVGFELLSLVYRFTMCAAHESYSRATTEVPMHDPALFAAMPMSPTRPTFVRHGDCPLLLPCPSSH